MKFTYAASMAALLGAVSAKDSRTFAVLRFTGDGPLTTGRMDPIVSPGKPSQHVHSVMGSSGFGMNATADDLANGKCSNALIKGDMSAYWFPNVYFKDPKSGNFESVDINYVNIYYFFEPTDDEIKAFPKGLQIVGGDANKRTAPSSSETNLDPSKGEIMNVKWTCPRLDNNYNPPSWPEGSDGSTSGIGDPINKGEGVGFPSVNCDGKYSPLRADVHLPSCYNPEAGLDNHAENMAWPEDNGQGKQNCPKGYIHVPHLFYEVYWETPAFADRWDQNSGEQPFVLSNGDATGFSSHADFFAAWDEDLLQRIIDTCDAGTAGMDQCGGLALNTEECHIESDVDEKTLGTLSSLPGDIQLLGWQYGVSGAQDTKPQPKASSAPSSASLPKATEPANNVVANAKVESKGDDSKVEAQAPKPTIAAAPAPAPAPSAESKVAEKPAGNNIKTIWETVTLTQHAKAAAPTAASASGQIDGFKYAGCFKDASDRTLSKVIRPDIGTVSNAKCISHCKSQGFSLAGTEYGGECYCGNELVGSEKLDASQCHMACTEDSADVCGGDWALSVYSSDDKVTLTSSKARRHVHGHGHFHRRSF